jgi:hypothetical protein
MGILRFVVWTSLCVALGIFLGSYEFHGRTTWQLVQGAWKQQGPRMEKVRDEAEDLVDAAKKKVSSQDSAAPAQQAPKERHSKEDRDAIDQLISKRSKG